MANNANPWRDLLSYPEWQQVVGNARGTGIRIGRAARPRAGGWQFAHPGGGGAARPTLASIGDAIRDYHLVAKDDHTRYSQRRTMLLRIKTYCEAYIRDLETSANVAKHPGGKRANDLIEVWLASIGRRAAKKSEYLNVMGEFEASAKTKYRRRDDLLQYLFGISQDNTRAGGEFLHATTYATIEKIDPYHRQTFVFLAPDITGQFIEPDPVNLLGEVFVDYLAGNPANNPDPTTNNDASFYEWLENHPFCVGTPRLTAGYDMKLKTHTRRVNYEGHDLTLAWPSNGMLVTLQQSDAPVAMPRPLNTASLPASGKGPIGGAAFVWARDGQLLLHPHGHSRFVHASAQKGKKIRCSGMMRVVNGKVEVVTNESGHYAPGARQIYNFVDWLYDDGCWVDDGEVEITHATDVEFNKTWEAFDFWIEAKIKYGNAMKP